MNCSPYSLRTFLRGTPCPVLPWLSYSGHQPCGNMENKAKQRGEERSNRFAVIALSFRTHSSLETRPGRRFLLELWTRAAGTKAGDFYGNPKHWMTGAQGPTKQSKGPRSFVTQPRTYAHAAETSTLQKETQSAVQGGADKLHSFHRTMHASVYCYRLWRHLTVHLNIITKRIQSASIDGSEVLTAMNINITS
jgi:hypothetical protein